MTPFIVFVASAILLVAILVAKSVSRVRRQNLVCYRRHRDRFFRQAEELIARSDFPVAASVSLRFFGGTLDDFAARLFLAAYALRERIGIPAGRRPTPRALEELTDEQKAEFFRAFSEAVQAVSYRSLLLGPLIRGRKSTKNSKHDRLDGLIMRRLALHGKRHYSPPNGNFIDACFQA